MPINFNLLQPQEYQHKIQTISGSNSNNSGGLSGIGSLLSGLAQFKQNMMPQAPTPGQPGQSALQGLMPGQQAPQVPTGPTATTLNVPAPVQNTLNNPVDINGLVPNAHPELASTMAGIAGVETGGAKNPYASQSIPSKNGDRAYGKYQIMGSNIPSWTHEALGHPMTPQQFLNDPQAQEKTAAYMINKNLQSYGPQDVASIWFSGRPQKQAGGARDAYGTSVPQYVNKFNQGYLHAREMAKNPHYSMNNKTPLREDQMGQDFSMPTVNRQPGPSQMPIADPDTTMGNTDYSSHPFSQLAMNSRSIPTPTTPPGPDYVAHPEMDPNVPLRSLTPEQRNNIMELAKTWNMG